MHLVIHLRHLNHPARECLQGLEVPWAQLDRLTPDSLGAPEVLGVLVDQLALSHQGGPLPPEDPWDPVALVDPAVPLDLQLHPHRSALVGPGNPSNQAPLAAHLIQAILVTQRPPPVPAVRSVLSGQLDLSVLLLPRVLPLLWGPQRLVDLEDPVVRWALTGRGDHQHHRAHPDQLDRLHQLDLQVQSHLAHPGGPGAPQLLLLPRDLVVLAAP